MQKTKLSPEKKENIHASVPLLEVRELDKTFGGLVAINMVSFSILQGEIVAIIGPNGAGKTTSFNMITGFLPPDHGDILFEGRNLSKFSAHQIASFGIARTFQNLQLFTNMTVLENVMMGRFLQSKAGMFGCAFRSPRTRREEKAIRDKAMEKLAMVGLEHQAHLEPLSLPYGKQKQLEIARALASEPKLLLIDEPAGGLSTHEIEDLANLILSIRDNGITALLVEHRMELVMGIADKVIVLNFGLKIAEGTPAEIQANEQVITAYLGEDF